MTGDIHPFGGPRDWQAHTRDAELEHLHAPSADPKQRMIDYWAQRCERAEAEIARLRRDISKLRRTLFTMTANAPNPGEIPPTAAP